MPYLLEISSAIAITSLIIAVYATWLSRKLVRAWIRNAKQIHKLQQRIQHLEIRTGVRRKKQ